jgi:two-component system, chemotaxis family, sensor kinase CheA
MDDFYAECDDHLIAIRQALLTLEEGVTLAGLNSDELELIFRSFHSLKGILGMAGLQRAERLAHRAEDYLRTITQKEGHVTSEGIDALTGVTNVVEQMVVAHRDNHEPPDSTAILQRLERLLNSSSAPQAGLSENVDDPLQGRIAEARRAGHAIWLCRFAPSPTLNERGINLNTVRPRLQRVGEILRSTPKVQSEGSIVFEFVIAGAAGADGTENWSQDGIEIIPFEAQAAARPGAEKPKAEELDRTPPRSLGFVAPSHIVRVDLSRLDDLMRIMGEMVVHRARLEELLGRVFDHVPTADGRALQDVNVAFTRELRNLREALMRVRLVPVGEIFDRMPFVVRDLAQSSGKKIRLVINGQDTEIDKYLVERLKDPLLHLVRNAISHGIESAEDRVAQGKPAEGIISLRASTAGEMVVIEVADDGAGVDSEKVISRARSAGLPIAAQPVLLDILCLPGFSTRDQADLAAGRGVGMAAVRTAILALGGELEMSTRLGEGTTFILRLPLTLAIADALIIAAGGQRFAMPQAAIQEIMLAQSSNIRQLERNELMTHRNAVLPLIRLSSLFGLPDADRTEFPVLVVGSRQRAVGIVADHVVGLREIVIRSISDPLLKVPAISGATELGDGRAVLILDTASLIRAANERKRVPLEAAEGPNHLRGETL